MEKSQEREEYAAEVADLDEAEAMVVPLSEMTSRAGWGTYMEVLKRLRMSVREGFESVESMEQVQYRKGLIEGLQLAGMAPGLIVAFVEREHAKQDARVTGRTRIRREILEPAGEETF